MIRYHRSREVEDNGDVAPALLRVAIRVDLQHPDSARSQIGRDIFAPEILSRLVGVHLRLELKRQENENNGDRVRGVGAPPRGCGT